MFRLVIFSCLLLATLALVSSNCQTKPSEGRIVGGHVRNVTNVPYQVSVQYKNRHRCGGSIIGPKHILTAAHCIKYDDDEDLFSIRAGSNYHDKDGQVVKVVNVISHPYYNPITSDYDASVLVLQEPLKSGEGVQIVTLANTEPRPGDIALISGWGSTEEGKYVSKILQSVVVPVVSKKVCERKYPKGEITDQMFCAGYLSGGQDSCKGDSGGPVLVKQKLAGIVSWAFGCGRKDLPGVNTNIAKILPWISAQIRE